MTSIRSGRQIMAAAIAVCMTCFASCDVRSTNPLSDPDRSQPDPRLYGTWLGQDEGSKEKQYFFSGKASETQRKDVPAGIMRVVGVGLGKDTVDRPMEYAFFVTKLQSGDYISAFDTDLLDESKHKSWDKTLIQRYILYKYHVSDDKLEIWPGREGNVQDAIKSGKVRGKITKNGLFSSAQLTDSTANLTEYLEKGGSRVLFNEDKPNYAMLLRRPRP